VFARNVRSCHRSCCVACVPAVQDQRCRSPAMSLALSLLLLMQVFLSSMHAAVVVRAW
jgi:hypothetical protein